MEKNLFHVKQDKIKYVNHKKIEQSGILDCTKEPCIITFPELTKIDFIKHGFSTRLGGVSTGCFSTMNLGFSRGDLPENVVTNFKKICSSIGVNFDDMVFTNQVHDTKIHVVTEKDRGRGVHFKPLTGIDGLITDVAELPLVTFYADCVPLYFVDKVKRVIGLSHSGWRGTVNKMGKKTVKAMTEQFGTNPQDVIAVIGPSICKDCYEVGIEVFNQFKEVFSMDLLKNIVEEKSEGKYQLNLWKANECILLEAGIPIENISISNICTYCNSTLLFSHRASFGERGNLAAFLSLKKI